MSIHAVPDRRRRAVRVLALLVLALVMAGPAGTAPQEITDLDITRAVEDALWADAATDANAIDVACRDGVATLTGTVATWAEADAAEQNAYDGGALEVRNRLLVEHQVYGPYPSYRDALMPFLVP